jgi:DNA replication protein DnaC
MQTVDPNKSETRPCWECGEDFESPDRYSCRLCPKCTAKAQKAAQNAILKKEIPPLYLTTDRSQLPSQLLQLIDGFDIESNEGLYISGQVGRYKTRTACLLLERYCRAGSTIAFIESTRFAELVRTQFHDKEYLDDNMLGSKGKSTGQKSRERLKKIKRVDALLIDDMGKEKRTDHVETELFALLEYRTSSMLPTIYTSNFSIGDLANRFYDQGLAILRRTTEFNQCVEV